MPTTLPSLSELQHLLDTCSGIFDIDTDIKNSLIQQEIDFKNSFLSAFADVGAPDIIVNVQFLKTNVQNYMNDGFTHLGVFFDIDFIHNGHDGQQVLGLTMAGVKFDRNDPAKTPKIASKYFTNTDVMEKQNQSNKNGKGTFKNKLSHSSNAGGDYNLGLYMRLTELLDRLNALEVQKVQELNVSLGFIKAQNEGDWNCIHLIFRANGKSDILFSTFEGYNWQSSVTMTRGLSETYGGPKLGTPPFGGEL